MLAELKTTAPTGAQLHLVRLEDAARELVARAGRPALQPVLYPTNEDLSVGAPVRRPAVQKRIEHGGG